MSPTATDPRVQQRERILEAARAALERAGPEALQARSLAAEIGASTQAIYTHFGGMPGLFEQLVLDGFAEFAAHVRAIPETDDAVADFFTKGGGYCEWALTHPQLYRLMFGLTGGALRQDTGLEFSMSGTKASVPEASSAASVLLDSFERVRQTGRIGDTDTAIGAGQFLSATHGYVLLRIGEAFGDPDESLQILVEFAVNLMVGMGDSREAAQRSLAASLAAREINFGT